MSEKVCTIIKEVFPTLSGETIDYLKLALKSACFPAQVTICNEGEIEDNFYIIVEGAVDIYKTIGGKRLLVNQLGPGGFFGDIALLMDVPRTAAIITAEPTEFLVIGRNFLKEVGLNNLEIVVAISRMVIRRFLLQEEKQLLEITRLKKRTAAPATIFISYARADQAFVSRLANNLLKFEIDVWLDLYRIDPGRSWARQIGEALDQCQIMLLVLSPAAFESENVDDEWNYFLDQKKKVVSVLHQPCKIPYRLSKLQYVDFNELDFDMSLARLVATLNTTL